jgi:hypothetical protein
VSDPTSTPATQSLSWTAPDLTAPTLVVITDEAIYLCSAAVEQAAGLKDRLEQGENPAAVFGSETQVIPLALITRIQTDRNENTLDITWQKEDEDEQEASVTFAEIGSRDARFMELTTHLGEGWEIGEDRFTRGRALLAPLGCIAGAIAATALLCWLATDDGIKHLHGHGKAALLRFVLQLLHPPGVLVVGSLVLAGLVYWLCRRWQQPPDLLWLSRRAAEPEAAQAEPGAEVKSE